MNTELFSQKAVIYDEIRPKYAATMMDFLAEHERLRGKTIADVGAGTGIFSRQLAELGNQVFAIEPNDDMRQVMSEQGQGAKTGITVVNGSAENTGLPDKSVDAVCAAQAFHWFDGQAFARECQRILRAGNKVYLTWNNDDRDRKNDDFQSIISYYCTITFKNNDTEEKIRQFYEDYEIYKFENPIIHSKPDFVKSVLSRSYAPKPQDAAYNDFVREIEIYFDRHNTDGYITLKNFSVLYIGNMRKIK